MSHPSDLSKTETNRRDFLKTTSVLAGGAALTGLSIQRGAHAAENNQLKLGLIGCGGRGTGAAGNALTADPNTVLTAMADAFEDRLENSHKSLVKQYGDRVQVPKEKQFTGFDGYKQVIGSGVDVVLLCTPPHFRPLQLKAAIEAGKHVFCEKPVAVDAPGIRSVLETTQLAKEKGLSLVSGLCWRYHPAVKETMQRILDGAIGDIRSIQSNYLTSTLWYRGEQDTEMATQMRNWYYFTWLSGDFNVEQHVHSLDKALWAFNNEPPVRAYGLGGREVRTEPKYGNIYDHMAVIYEYPDGKKVHSYCRQQKGCYNITSDELLGSKGRAIVTPKHEIEGENPWRFQGEAGNMYVLEHEALYNSIRSGEPINNGLYMARSTMMGILGRMVCYTGKAITWDEAMASKEDLTPSAYAWDADPPILPDADGKYPVAVPGQTPFV